MINAENVFWRTGMMATATFDTHHIVKKLTAEQFTEKQAETIVEAIREATEAKAADTVTQVQHTAFKSEMKADFTELRKDMKAMEIVLRSDMSAMESSLRHDMSAMEGSLRSDMKAMESGLRHDMNTMEGSLRKDIERLDHKIEVVARDITIRLGGMIVALGGILVAIRFFEH